MCQATQVIEGRFSESRDFIAGSFEYLQELLERVHIVAELDDDECEPLHGASSATGGSVAA